MQGAGREIGVMHPERPANPLLIDALQHSLDEMEWRQNVPSGTAL